MVCIVDRVHMHRRLDKGRHLEVRSWYSNQILLFFWQSRAALLHREASCSYIFFPGKHLKGKTNLPKRLDPCERQTCNNTTTAPIDLESPRNHSSGSRFASSDSFSSTSSLSPGRRDDAIWLRIELIPCS